MNLKKKGDNFLGAKGVIINKINLEYGSFN